MRHHTPERETPHRWQAIVFHLKTRLFQLRRGFTEIGNRSVAYGKVRSLIDSPVIATEACGLPPHEMLHVVAAPDAAALATVIRSILPLSLSTCVA